MIGTVVDDAISGGFKLPATTPKQKTHDVINKVMPELSTLRGVKTYAAINVGMFIRFREQ